MAAPIREIAFAPTHSPAADPARQRRALVWDSKNTSSVLIARALRARGWAVDWIGSPASIWRESDAFDGTRNILDAVPLERVLAEHPLDALFLHGDDQIRRLLDSWKSLPPHVRRHLSDPDALETALSKHASMDLARRLNVPVLPTAGCYTPEEARAASIELAPGGQVVLKGEGGSAGSTVRAMRAGSLPDAATWASLTRLSEQVMVQRRITGPRMLVTVVYEHGHERAACAHEKVAAWPADFGITAFGVTRHVHEVHEYAHRLFQTLGWHGPANVEFRQDRTDGRWYFMEINPRVGASVGIQAAAGVDIAATWAAVAAGDGEREAPGRAYREGVRYAWSVPALSLAMARPLSVPVWGWKSLLNGDSDLAQLDPALRGRALKLALWMARR